MLLHYAPLAHPPDRLSPPRSRSGGSVEPRSGAKGALTLLPARPSPLRSTLRAVPRLADPFREAGVLAGVRDGDFLLTCSCGMQQRLDAMTIDECGDITLYDCARCTKSVVGVMTDDPDVELRAPGPLTRREEQAGHRLHGYVIGARVDVALHPEGAERDLVLIPATPTFFERYRYL